MDRQRLEKALAEFPLYAYAFIATDELVFSDRVRVICAHECVMYDTTWSCPPAVGTVEACRARALCFREGLMIATVGEAGGIDGAEATRNTRAAHQRVTRDVLELVRREATETLALSAEACTCCEQCTYPDGPCRHPDTMIPCAEGYGILLTDLAERHGIDCFGDSSLLTWISLILYK